MSYKQNIQALKALSNIIEESEYKPSKIYLVENSSEDLLDKINSQISLMPPASGDADNPFEGDDDSSLGNVEKILGPLEKMEDNGNTYKKVNPPGEERNFIDNTKSNPVPQPANTKYFNSIKENSMSYDPNSVLSAIIENDFRGIKIISEEIGTPETEDEEDASEAINPVTGKPFGDAPEDNAKPNGVSQKQYDDYRKKHPEEFRGR